MAFVDSILNYFLSGFLLRKSMEPAILLRYLPAYVRQQKPTKTIEEQHRKRLP